MTVIAHKQVFETTDPERGDGSRKDYGKDAGFWLLPRRPIIALAHVFDIGAKKYAPRGWEKGMEWSRVIDPLFRHLFKWLSGEKYDPTDGQHHLASVAWAALVLMEYEETHPELDDLRRGNLVPAPLIDPPAWVTAGGYVDRPIDNVHYDRSHPRPTTDRGVFGDR